jgi:NTE family protein
MTSRGVGGVVVMPLKRETRMAETSDELMDALNPPVAMVFGGGASLGAVQVGMVRALLDAGVRPDMIVGTSVGALNGSYLACDFSHAQVDRLADIWRGITREDVFPGASMWRAAKMLIGGDRYLSDRDGIERLTRRHLPERHDELNIETTVMASDLVTGEKVTLAEGDLRRHVQISASIPFIFEPIEHEGRILVDGGVTSNVPVVPATQLGARSLIVLDPGYPCALDSAPADLLGFSLHIVTLMIRHQSHGALHFLEDESQVVYLPPPCPVDVPPHDFSQTSHLIEKGHERAEAFLNDLDVDGAGVYGHPHFHGSAVELY